ncbi:MAG TPA: hypothetical protein VEL07_08485 [Planctomycetota bacterium]|nr:hypothetical protein [Planctomycetota bacterium]
MRQQTAGESGVARLQRALIAGVDAFARRVAHDDGGRWPAFAPIGDAVAGEAGLRALIGLGNQRLLAWTKGANDPVVEDLVARVAARPPHARRPDAVVVAALRRRLPSGDDASVAAIANLLQLNLLEREDGALLQDLFALYVALGLKVNLAQLGVAHDDAAIIAIAGECAAASDAGPYPGNDAAYWRLSFTRVEMWGDKVSGRRDHRVLARELAREPGIAALLPALAALPERRVAFIGFSMMMSVNWSCHGAWNDIASEVVKAVNPRFASAGFQQGGIRGSAAIERLLPPALAWKPTEAFLLMAAHDQADEDAFVAMAERLTAHGCETWIVDDNRPWIDREDGMGQILRRRAAARRAGVGMLPFYDLGRTARDWASWECLDRIHMTTPGHVFYARALLRLWADRG